MKTLPLFAAVILLSAGSAYAQSAGPGVDSSNQVTTAHSMGHDVTGFSSKRGPGITQQDANRPPNPNVVLHPQIGGATVAVAKYGPVMFSPTAPAEYGNGERYLAAPDARYDLDHESGPAAHRDTGGIKFLSLEF